MAIYFWNFGVLLTMGLLLTNNNKQASDLAQQGDPWWAYLVSFVVYLALFVTETACFAGALYYVSQAL